MIAPDSSRLITVFGGGGFIGRYVCERLLAADVRVRVASREPRCAHFLQPLGHIGQLGTVRADVTRPDSVRRAVEGATAVVNLVGAFDQMQAIHVRGARNIAEAASEAGAEAFVHISAIGADPDSPSNYGRTKGEGEEAVRSAFPKASILRPSVVFGPEDDFTNKFAGLGALPVLPVIKPGARLQPVYVEDLAKAIAAAALDPQRHGGKTYEIAGPDILTMRELIELVTQASGRDPQLVNMPDFAASALASMGWLPGAPITRDQWLMLQQDNIAGDAPGLAAFGIAPTPLAAVADEWLGRFRRGGRFAMRTPPADAI